MHFGQTNKRGRVQRRLNAQGNGRRADGNGENEDGVRATKCVSRQKQGNDPRANSGRDQGFGDDRSKSVGEADAGGEGNKSVLAVASGFGGVVPVVKHFEYWTAEANQEGYSSDDLRRSFAHRRSIALE